PLHENLAREEGELGALCPPWSASGLDKQKTSLSSQTAKKYKYVKKATPSLANLEECGPEKARDSPRWRYAAWHVPCTPSQGIRAYPPHDCARMESKTYARRRGFHLGSSGTGDRAGACIDPRRPGRRARTGPDPHPRGVLCARQCLPAYGRAAGRGAGTGPYRHVPPPWLAV